MTWHKKQGSNASLTGLIRSFSTKESFVSSAIVILFIAAVLVSYLQDRGVEWSRSAYVQRIGTDITSLIASALASEYRQHDPETLQDSLSQLIPKIPYIQSVVVRGNTDQIIATLNAYEAGDPADLRLFSSNYLNGSELKLQINVALDVTRLMTGYEQDQLNLYSFISYIMIIAGLVLILLVNVAIINPIDEIRNYVQEKTRPGEIDGFVSRRISDLRKDTLKIINERQHQESELVRARAQLHAVLDTVGEAIITVDQDSRIIMANQSAEKMWGVSLSRLENMRLDQLMPERYRRQHHDGMERYVSTGEARVLDRRVELSALHADGHEFPIEIYISETRVNGNLLFTAAVRDITERKNNEEALRAANLSVERRLDERTRELMEAQLLLVQAEKMETIGILAAGVAHEVKNPLAIIKLGVDYLKLQLSRDVAATEIISDVDEAVKRADQVIHQLMDFSAAKDLNLASLSIAEVIEESLQLVRHELLKYKVEVEFEPAPPALEFRGDRQKLQQVFINLFLNSIHAMPDGGVLGIAVILDKGAGFDLDASISRLRPRQSLRVEITDTGTGISDQHVDSIMKPFFTTKIPGQGTGLGLTVVENLMRLHNGRMIIKNRPERGVQVTLLFDIPGGNPDE